MKKLLLTFCLLLSAAAHAAGEENPIDSEFAHCMDKASTTLAMSQCYADAQKSWDHEMKTQYQAALAKRSGQKKEQLRTAQRNWLKYRDSWMSAASAWFSQQQGTMASLSVGAQRVELIKKQAQMLKSLNDSTCANPDDC